MPIAPQTHQMIRDWHNKQVSVMGLGRFGGGVGVVRWLATTGAQITVTDQAPAGELEAALQQISDLDVNLHLGGHVEADFRDADLVVVNPAVPETSEFLQIARDDGVPITTEINLFVERCPARTVGVTGSVGKSTITAMIGHLLKAGTRRVWVGGNIGRSLLDGLGRMTADDIVVLELSSFQLQRTPTVAWSPSVAVITNITPNHLDWHGSFEDYAAAKLNIMRHQSREHGVVIAQDTPALRELLAPHADQIAHLWYYGLDGDVPAATAGAGTHRLRWEDARLTVPGRHNRQNAAAALTAAHVLALPADSAVSALTTFQALPHRLREVAQRDGVTYYDDSKSTTPQAAMTALEAIDTPVLIILGGYDKGSDLRPLAELTARRARFAACIGTTGSTLATVVRQAGGQAENCGELAAAVAECQRRAQPGDTILLSPACASWDQFPDYRVRGETFARLARSEPRV